MGIFRELTVYPRLLTRVFPLVERELAGWRAAAAAIPDADLRAQSLSSLERKKFHCVGGAVLALMAPDRLPQLVRAIVAIQTISDYLDNLCDRSLVAAQVTTQAPQDAEVYLAYMRLHESMLCAVDPHRDVVDYYGPYLRLLGNGTAGHGDCRPSETAMDGGHPPPEALVDGGYLDSLVEASRLTLRELPGHAAAKPLVTTLVTLYSELQAGKHLPLAIRDGVMERWHAEHASELAQPTWLWLNQSPVKWLGHDLRWWEFGAATGSTLAMFALICASSDPALSPVAAEALASAYFPSICGLHILLDYYIDQAEDVAGGDLNFVAHYLSQEEAVDALEGFTRWALHQASSCESDPGLHRAAVRGLLAMYLSDPKVSAQGLGRQASRLIRAAGGLTLPLKSACSLSRRLTGF